MKKYILVLLLTSILINKTNACSWSSEDGTFYNLFDQQLISDKSLQPFFLTYDYTFYGDNLYEEALPAAPVIDYNIVEWRKYFDNQLSESDLSFLVYKSSVSDLSGILSSKSLKNINDTLKKSIYLTEKGSEAINYLLFAKKCEQFAIATEEDNSNNSWSYIGVRKKMTKPEYMSTAKTGNLLYASTKNTAIKLRIAYQLVRLSHYGGFNEDAIRYFNTYVEPLKQKSLLYYYALEQKGGALFNQKKFAEAGCIYAEVFDHTTDRKIPCYASFRISNQMSFDKAILLCKTPNEKAALYVLRGFNKFSNGLSELKNIYAIAPNSAYLELMACRALLQMEHSAFQIPNQYGSKNTFPLMNISGKAYLQKAILFTETLLKENKVKRIDFWQAYLAHLYLLNGDYVKSQTTAQKIISTDKLMLAQRDRTAFCAYIGNLKTIDASAEAKIYEHFLQNKEEKQKGFVYEILGHNYILQKNLAKAFLCHNNFSGLYGSLNIAIINDLIDFVSKKSKTNFEEQLINDKISFKDPLSELYDLKGTHYFKNDDLENALIWYKKVSKNLSFLKLHEYDYDKNITIEKEGSFNGYSNIYAGIFSSKVQTFFDNTEANAFSDKTYQSFSFINSRMNKQELVEALIQLKKISAGKDEQAAKANFLLGNFYYNTSHWGYYRNFFYYEAGNYYLSYLYGYNNTPEPSVKKYNYNDGTGLISVNHPQKAYDYFLKAESVSSDNELKAKTVFQAAKCELDMFFQKQDDLYFGYGGNYKLLYSTSTRPMFKRLKDNYAQTAYYKDIQSNCNYFKYYLQYRL